MSFNKYSGLIVFRIAHKKPIEYLLYIDTYTDHKHYSPPKGKIVTGDHEKKTALWVTSQLTGLSITDIDIIDNFRASIQYLHKNEIKIITLHLGRVQDYKKSFKIGSTNSGINIKWLKIEEAIEKAKFSNMQKVLKKADEYIASISSSWLKSPSLESTNHLSFQTNSLSSNNQNTQINPPSQNCSSSNQIVSKNSQYSDSHGALGADNQKYTNSSLSELSKNIQSSTNTSQTPLIQQKNNSYSGNHLLSKNTQPIVNEENYYKQNYNSQRFYSKNEPNSLESASFKSYNGTLPLRGFDSKYNSQAPALFNSEVKSSSFNEKTYYKTKLCQMFQSTGECRYGNNCTFAHSKSELVPNINNTSNLSQKYDPRKIINPTPTFDSNSNFKQNSNRHNIHYKTRLCNFFMSNGYCTEGENCNYAHGEADLQPSIQRKDFNYELASQASRCSDNETANQNSYIPNKNSSDYNNSYNRLSQNYNNDKNMTFSSNNYNNTYYSHNTTLQDQGYSIYSNKTINQSVAKTQNPSIGQHGNKYKIYNFVVQDPNFKFDDLNELENAIELSGTENSQNDFSREQNTDTVRYYRSNSIIYHKNQRRLEVRVLASDVEPSSTESKNNIKPTLKNRYQSDRNTDYTRSYKAKDTINDKHNIRNMDQLIPKTEFNPQFTSKSTNQHGAIKNNEKIFLKTPHETKNRDNHKIIIAKKPITKYEDTLSSSSKTIENSVIPAQNSPKSNIYTLEKLTITAFQNYFYGSENNTQIIQRPINEELKEINKVEFRLNLTLYYSGLSLNETDTSNDSIKSIWSNRISSILMEFYYQDLIEEEDFLLWYNSNMTANSDPALQSMKSFAEWLVNAEEE
ncbi:hypothetical protein BB561_000494 [Smittium simulii]|uniref:Uncharacterized protein n=1 Tax=Smittium simulii TaxID=133385 RepID=A0A2T9YZ23_9FUNG|nr:hypothetical protein BB561_000494 [Smittium simulii]